MLAIGNEVAEGRVDNDNARWFGRQFGRTIAMAVGDDAAEVLPALRFLSRCRVVVVSGGLGPTVDDLTRDFACRWLRCGVQQHRPTLRKFTGKLHRAGIKDITPNNAAQALYPAAAAPLDNPVGGAVGFTVRRAKTRYYFFPGVPKEFRAMVTRHVARGGRRPKRSAARAEYADVYQFTGVPESTLDTILQERLPVHLRTRYGIYPKLRGVDVILRTDQGRDRTEFRKTVRAHLEKFLVVEGDAAPEEKLVRLLRRRRRRLALAESCTAGLLAATITNVPGASRVLIGGVVAYSNALKRKFLGVRPDTLARAGAVSRECAKEMASGALKKLGGDIAVSITGIAGPTRGTRGKPAGTVWFGFAVRGNAVQTERQRFVGDREAVRERSVAYAISRLIRLLA
ncbi:MAG: hypothetical protein A3G34_06385 [Candidatus Lindowbacteria bacterium RIFCSPLOWO2_12_FULL_62_27]|nr:MAG: hypothetical protein A3G34_06385 [Candidatus Lindowbacteria bacterium RIFCSPLOWO2_12_FULL_62_27]